MAVLFSSINETNIEFEVEGTAQLNPNVRHLIQFVEVAPDEESSESTAILGAVSAVIVAIAAFGYYYVRFLQSPKGELAPSEEDYTSDGTTVASAESKLERNSRLFIYCSGK